MERPLLLNRIKTPDGTILTSFYTHDFKTHQDANGETYMVDGGLSYLRRSAGHKEPFEELSVVLSDNHEKNRYAFHWGTRGPDGKQPLTHKCLVDLSVSHIKAILETQHHIKDWVRDLLITELKYRGAMV